MEEVELQKQVNSVVEGAVYAQIREQIALDIRKIDQSNKVKNRNWKVAGALGILLVIGFFAVFFSKDNNSKQGQKSVQVAEIPAPDTNSGNQIAEAIPEVTAPVSKPKAKNRELPASPEKLTMPAPVVE